jgi:hypothetical protein
MTIAIVQTSGAGVAEIAGSVILAAGVKGVNVPSYDFWCMCVLNAEGGVV